MTNQEWYREYARLLGVSYDCTPFPHCYRTRWNNRSAGSGRYAGRGIIRIFGDQVHVGLTNPELQMVGTKEEVRDRLLDLTN